MLVARLLRLQQVVMAVSREGSVKCRAMETLSGSRLKSPPEAPQWQTPRLLPLLAAKQTRRLVMPYRSMSIEGLKLPATGAILCAVRLTTKVRPLQLPVTGREL